MLPAEPLIENCSRCGFCLTVCPTYQATLREVQSPRGRMALIYALSRGELNPNSNLVQHLYHCLDCRACQTICPSGIKIGEMVTEVRARLPHPLTRGR